MNPEPLFHGLDRVGPATRAVLTGLRHRGELAAIEAGEAGGHLAGSLALGLGSLAFTLLGGVAVNLALAAAVWHRDDRGLVLAVVGVVELLLAVLAGLLFARRLRRWRPLAETRRQLDADYDCILDLLPGGAATRSPRPTP